MINPLFKKNWFHFCIQILIILLFIFSLIIALFFIEKQAISLLTAVGLTSLSATAFIMFSSPSVATAEIKKVIFAYFIAIVIGIACHHLLEHINFNAQYSEWVSYAAIVCVSIAISIFLMGLFDMAHPPAVAFSVALVMQTWNDKVLIITVIVLLLMVLVKYLLRNWLITIV